MNRPLRLALVFGLTCLALWGAAPDAVRAEDGVALPQSDATLDAAGRVPAEAWGAARALSSDRVEVADIQPLDPKGGDEEFAFPKKTLQASVRGLLIDGCLAIRAELAEPPSTEIGLGLMVVRAAARAAPAGSNFLYQPFSPRAAEHVVYTPAGVGRSAVWCQGAAVLQKDRYVVELVVPLAPLVLEAHRQEDLRIAAMVFTRTPNVWLAVPEGARWKEPSHWLRLSAPEGGWPSKLPTIDTAAVAQADRRDTQARDAWRRFQEGMHSLLTEKTMQGSPALLREQFDEALYAPLREMREARPALATVSHLLTADIHRQLGEADAARREYEAALASMPGCREAQAPLLFQVLAPSWVQGKTGGATDFAAMHAAIDEAAKALADNPYLADAVTYAHARVRQREGERVATPKLLRRLGLRYAAFREITFHAEEARREADAWPEELLARRKEADQNLPRVALHTTKGKVVIELFENRAPNTVNNFVYLAKAGFYDGMAFHRVLPAFVAQTGDPFSKAGADAEKLGTGGPGYSVPYEASGRYPLRGAVAMAHHGRDTEGSQFVLFTGNAGHQHEQMTVFGRIVEGQAQADALTREDRIERIEMLRLTEGRVYHPNTIAGELAPAPEATSFR